MLAFERTREALGPRYRLERIAAASTARVLFEAYDETLKRRVRSWSFVAVERQFPLLRKAIISDVEEFNSKRHDAVVFKSSFRLGGERLLMTTIREGV